MVAGRVLLSARAIFSFVIQLQSIAAHSERELSFERIAGYTPLTKVTDYAAIDLDQQEIENHIQNPLLDYNSARAVYRHGGHSRSFATLRLRDRAPIDIVQGSRATGVGNDGNIVVGRVLENVSEDSRLLLFVYETADTFANYLTCQVGGRSDPNTSGCLAEDGSIDVDGVGELRYSYDPEADNLNGRTIQGFSVTALFEMRLDGDGGEYFEIFQKYVDYYGTSDYGNQWVTAALTNGETTLERGNANFEDYADDGREEAIKRGTVLLNIFMFVIRQLEDAVYDCEKGCAIDECNDDAYNSLDAAVALYTGSLQVTQSDNGIMLYDLAERRCSNFNTCDDDLSKVNRALFSAFNRMQESLVSRNCNDALTTKGRITQLMYIPLIQGALLASFFNSQLGDASLRTEGRGATFAASVLPIVHACNAEDASIIYENTRVGRTTSSNFTAVKIAFERNYACLGLTCADVGGIWNRAQMDYFDDAAPCMDAVPSVTVRPTGMPSSPPPVTTVPTSSPMNITTEPTLPDAFPNVTESPSPIPQGTETPVPVDRLPTIAPTPLTTNPPLERSQLLLGGFNTETYVMDEAVIDLDMEKIVEQIAEQDLLRARNVYRDGGHSKSFAILTLQSPPPNKSLKKSTLVAGWTEKSTRVFGSVLEDVSWQQPSPDGITIKVLYDLKNTEPCQSGGLFTLRAANRDGCFAETGTILLRAQQGSEDEHFDYTYDGREDNDNDRTIQKFSTNAATEMQRCVGENDCVFFPDYQLYIDYYQNRAYANKWFTAAFQEENTEFLGGRGDADFNSLESGEAIGEAMKTGALILNIWMAVVRELEVAIDACRRPCDETTTPGEQQCNMDALRAVDSAAAFYVGSLEGRDGGGLGMLLYDLADKTASFFKTKGPLGVSDTGTAYVNLEIIRLLTEAQRLLRGKEADSESTGLCNNVENIKQEIVNLMKVPLVQGTLRAAWNRRVVATNAVDEAQGATFAASLLPYVYNCQKSHALLLHNSLRIGSNATADTFTTVRDALEEIYDCLGVTCDQVGGIWNGESFETGAEPCTEDESRETPSSSSAVHVSLVNTTIYWLGLVLGAFLASTV